jgi:hypothetical protein
MKGKILSIVYLGSIGAITAMLLGVPVWKGIFISTMTWFVPFVVNFLILFASEFILKLTISINANSKKV